MRILDKQLENRIINIKALELYGFKLNNNIYTYEKNILDNDFKVIVNVMNNKMTSKLIENALNDEYLMIDVEDVTGEYINALKQEYHKVIDDIVDKCTSKNIFKSNQAKDIIKYIKDKYNDDLEYLWTKFPNNAIWRNKNNNKWYGAILVLEENKLGIISDKVIDILDLRYPKDKITDIVDEKVIYPGYHMNKNNWITIKLDNSLDIEEIYNLIDISYNISLKNNLSFI